MIIFTTIICLTVKTFTDFINIAGAVGSVTVGFVLPELLYLKAFKVTMLEKAGCLFIATFGILGSIYSICYSVSKMVVIKANIINQTKESCLKVKTL